jgi:hypothetical protein
LSWQHFGSAFGPTLAVGAAFLLVAWDTAEAPAGPLLGILGLLAAILSANVVLERTAEVGAGTRRVRNGELSANAAMLEAGFRKPKLRLVAST